MLLFTFLFDSVNGNFVLRPQTKTKFMLRRQHETKFNSRPNLNLGNPVLNQHIQKGIYH